MSRRDGCRRGFAFTTTGGSQNNHNDGHDAARLQVLAPPLLLLESDMANSSQDTLLVIQIQRPAPLVPAGGCAGSDRRGRLSG